MALNSKLLNFQPNLFYVDEENTVTFHFNCNVFRIWRFGVILQYAKN